MPRHLVGGEKSMARHLQQNLKLRMVTTVSLGVITTQVEIPQKIK